MKNRYKRFSIQGLFFLLTNSHLKGFFTGRIYQGSLKKICVPGLNCYSCPGALFSCPIGALQQVLGSFKHNFSFYVLGFMGLYGALFGRLICGFLCPFGWVQDMLGWITKKKIMLPALLKSCKYLVLVSIFILPLIWQDSFGQTSPYFCAYICPSGTFLAGLPLISTKESLRHMIGHLFILKTSILVAVLLLSIPIKRFFCKTICPLGALYSFFNKVSFYQMSYTDKTCIHCEACVHICPMDVNIKKDQQALECIRCLQCKTTCPTKSIQTSFINKKKPITDFHTNS